MHGYPQFFFVDSNSPCKDLIFPCGTNLPQNPFHLVCTLLNGRTVKVKGLLHSAVILMIVDPATIETDSSNY